MVRRVAVSLLRHFARLHCRKFDEAKCECHRAQRVDGEATLKIFRCLWLRLQVTMYVAACVDDGHGVFILLPQRALADGEHFFKEGNGRREIVCFACKKALIDQGIGLTGGRCRRVLYVSEQVQDGADAQGAEGAFQGLLHRYTRNRMSI